MNFKLRKKTDRAFVVCSRSDSKPAGIQTKRFSLNFKINIWDLNIMANINAVLLHS